MIPRLEALEDRFLPDATPLSLGAFVAQMQAVVQFDQLMASNIQALFGPPNATITGSMIGMAADALLLANVSNQLAAFIPDMTVFMLQAQALG